MKEMLEQILLTLNGLEVKGRQNIEKLFCVMCALEQMIADDSTKTQEGEMNG